RTKEDYQFYMDYYLADWMQKPVASITPEKFSQRYIHIGENNGRTVANNVRRVLSSMLNFGIASYHLLEKNPTRIIAETKSAYPDNRRQNYIKPHQLKAWHTSVCKLQNEVYRDYLL